MITKRQSAIAKAVGRFIPQAPFYDAEAVRAHAAEKHLRGLTPETAAWLALIAYIRHTYTNYDDLRNEGYEREAARFFIHETVNKKLQEWRATRFLIIEETPNIQNNDRQTAEPGAGEETGLITDTDTAKE